jgi:hypothetical protein
MEFSRHPDVRTERLDQVAAALGLLYPPVGQVLPAIIADKLEQLERAEQHAKRSASNNA